MSWRSAPIPPVAEAARVPPQRAPGMLCHGAGIPDSSSTQPASLSHPAALIHFTLLQNKFTARAPCGQHVLWTQITGSFGQACNNSKGSCVICWELTFKKAVPPLPSLLSQGADCPHPPQNQPCSGHTSSQRDERDGSEARSSRLTQGVSEAAKTHPSNVSAWLSQRECSRLCLHGKIVLVSFRV